MLESTPRLIASPAAWADRWTRQKIEDIALMLKGTMAAEGKVWLSMNARRTDLDAVLANPARTGRSNGCVFVGSGVGGYHDDSR